MGLSCVQGPGRPWHELTSWCTGGCRCPPGAAACWVLSCCGQQIFSRCGRRCQGSRSYWPAGCSGGVSSWDRRTSASRLSRTAGKIHQWCIPLWRKERKISLVLLNSSSKCFKKRWTSSIIEQILFGQSLVDKKPDAMRRGENCEGSQALAAFWKVFYMWCQNLCLSVCDRLQTSCNSACSAKQLVLGMHCCTSIQTSQQRGPLCAAVWEFEQAKMKFHDVQLGKDAYNSTPIPKTNIQIKFQDIILMFFCSPEHLQQNIESKTT